MSILIKDMEMPNACWACEGCDGDKKNGYFCILHKDAYDLVDIDIFKEKPDWCPLVEIPTPHGDLIDRNEVLNACEFIGEKPTWDNPYTDDTYGCKSSVIENMKAVIEAEK